ncbi:hypothetical protein GOP47_0014250 [Adiantum capillus-veneris]|uniref:Uncharacterized protein n=1 Tax=Adiantum capillus-veneris TaxID=13818 RepID=A0A9D4ZDB8_ADICA|nr:hypothetical protein GOP47_0014250 [Adiantum capillus-veneris]
MCFLELSSATWAFSTLSVSSLFREDMERSCLDTYVFHCFFSHASMAFSRLSMSNFMVYQLTFLLGMWIWHLHIVTWNITGLYETRVSGLR